MKLLILAVGDKLPAWAEAAVTDYVKRMPREMRVEVVAIKPEKRAGQSPERIKALEAARVLDKLPDGCTLVALDEHGREVSTRELAQLLDDWRGSGRDVALAIGGADGLAAPLLAQAAAQLSLSRLTLPHALARVLLAEQLYRAWSLLANHPYHRD
ncbi:23S rRNA (pseudouridine(1915)-N(3))-methyltransferase RlmH [Parasulfuritortus cantonensis]|uniref:Ribosomal RNA large subunit methyltransferase H n=1 Tax=Parasulfuritortus cantonensis TaxID=2528202 RepID=A0A4R1BCY9_9PROT|nr:23S rRNA (pseudouridine(1915)-N(3))-methyltransferase RlmH [Parasulfuritortus cantonensis]TCJ14945.1 23S rRNA (pseudouridine(1915)-N(3))-methyltransferase RlmH [Parasulfuritortus cantonensis]